MRCNEDACTITDGCYSSPVFILGKSIQRTDARLGWHTPDQRWGVGVYLNTMFNQRYVLSVRNDTTDVFGMPYATITPPRTYGVELHAKF